MAVATENGSAGKVIKQYLTFRLGEDVFGLDILRVREIRGWSKPREIPNVPKYIKGVMDFRGGIVPIIDLRLRFALANADYDKETVVILVSVEQDGRSAIMGIVVDRVADVMDVEAQEIKPRPDLGVKLDTSYLPGIVNREDRMVLLVDVDKLLDTRTFSLVEELPQS
jgi:purine-binding chemotaxis protein CheW